MELPTRAVTDKGRSRWVLLVIRAGGSKANLLLAISCKATRLLPAERPAFDVIVVALARLRTTAMGLLHQLQPLPVGHLGS